MLSIALTTLLIMGCRLNGSPAGVVPTPIPTIDSKPTEHDLVTTEMIVSLSPSFTASETPLPTLTHTFVPSPSFTPGPQSQVEVSLLDCMARFCPPEELDQWAKDGETEPGILEVVVLGELTARIIYDPTQLSEEEAVQAFGRATRLDVEVQR